MKSLLFSHFKVFTAGKSEKLLVASLAPFRNTCDCAYIDVAEKLPQVFRKDKIFVCTKVAFALTLVKIILLLEDFSFLSYQSVFSGFGFYPCCQVTADFMIF